MARDSYSRLARGDDGRRLMLGEFPTDGLAEEPVAAGDQHPSVVEVGGHYRALVERAGPPRPSAGQRAGSVGGYGRPAGRNVQRNLASPQAMAA